MRYAAAVMRRAYAAALVAAQSLTALACALSFVCKIAVVAALLLSVLSLALALAMTLKRGCRAEREQAAKIVSAFPQVRKIEKISCKRKGGGLCFDLLLRLNTYSVRGDGSITAKSLENAMRRHFGDGTQTTVTILPPARR